MEASTVEADKKSEITKQLAMDKGAEDADHFFALLGWADGASGDLLNKLLRCTPSMRETGSMGDVETYI